ncbi:MurR/RpiR family transcriptional regulator [Salirhabdus salicampi]|uniref:MurR/RpiR family transcriptional regulator n=1 Tax=Salirhabdus salicampi TaxID=476102 RepID=UPI0020C1CF8C|nr:MurR/RpiR family transcriptional regulator [Salirhabdus salicampi]MCP8616139.1 MurR/RpiR family transcriptional regulator [Salirhabdus salicampi]
MANVYQLIAEKVPSMSKSQEKIATYILENPTNVPFLTVRKLAQLTNVSEATIVRFATFIGYTGFPEFQQAMQDSLQKQLTTTERLQMSSKVYNDQNRSIFDLFQDDMDNIQDTIRSLDVSSFQKAVDVLLHARKVYILANRSAMSLGIFMDYYLRIVLDNVENVTSYELISERFYNLDKEDVVIGISFPRYTKSTVQSFAYAKQRGATTICLTDNLLSPLVPNADISLTASSRMPSFIDSFVAPLSLINAIITQLGNKKQIDIKEKLDQLEQMWDHLDIFYT